MDPIFYQCSSCHSKRVLSDFIQNDNIYKSCQGCLASRIAYHAENRERIKSKRYGNKNREACPCGSSYFLYCKESIKMCIYNIEYNNQLNKQLNNEYTIYKPDELNY